MTTNAFEVRKNNLRNLVMEKFEGNRAAYSRAAGVHQNQVNLLLTANEEHRRNLGEALARRMEVALGIDSGYFDANHSVGSAHRITGWDIPEAVRTIFGPASVLEMALADAAFAQLDGRITSKDSLKLCRTATTDMAPEIMDSENCLVDTGVKAVTVDGVYVVQMNSAVFLRRVTKMMSGGWVIQTANPVHEVLKVDNLNGIRTVARLVMVVRHLLI